MPQGRVVLVAPYPGPGAATPMTWQAVSEMRYRMPGGYFVGPRPDGAPAGPLAAKLIQPGAGWDVPKLDPYRRLTYTSDLVRWRVRTVVVGPMRDRLRHDNTVEMLTELLGRPPSREGGVDVWWDVRPRRLMDEAERGPG